MTDPGHSGRARGVEIIDLVLEALEHSAGRLGGCGSIYAGLTLILMGAKGAG